MPQCEHCGEVVSTSRYLKRHQTSVLYCLEIQKGKGLTVKADEHKCKCGSVFTQKGNLTRHSKSCKIIAGTQAVVISNSTINSHNTTNIGTQNIMINQTITPIKPFTMTDLTRDYILTRLTPVITKEIVKSGMGAITELVVEVLLQKDGKYCYYCTDKSRKKFTMVIDHEGQVVEQKDPNAQCLRSLLLIPLQSIVSEIAEIHLLKSVQDTYKEVKELKRDGSGFMSTLASSLPCDADGIPECMKGRIQSDLEDITEIKRLEERDQRIKLKVLRKNIEDNM